MLVRIKNSDEFDCVEFNFSDGSNLKVSLFEASKMRDAISNAIILALTLGVHNAGYHEDCQEVEVMNLYLKTKDDTKKDD